MEVESPPTFLMSVSIDASNIKDGHFQGAIIKGEVWLDDKTDMAPTSSSIEFILKCDKNDHECI